VLIIAERSDIAHPLSQYVLKVHSRCDLACDHCYVYEHADQSWKHQPTRMTEQTVEAAAQRIAQHAQAHELPSVTVVLHGGEPLLLGLDAMRMVLNKLNAIIGSVTTLRLRMQSNGIRLDEAFCEMFVECGLKVGVSFDGDRTANDRHRRYANGASSYNGVRRALELLRRPEYRQVYAGILCTVDIANDPLVVYDALLAEDPPAIDFLLPHATWEHPPTRTPDQPAPYADWLRRIHRQWTADGRRVRIRMFDAIHATGAGGRSGSEAFGLDPKDLVVVETDGSWEQVDSLKTAYDGAAQTGLDVFRHSVDAAAAHPGIAQRQQGADGLCATCRACPVVGQCGGGLFAHRYRPGNGFDNPSVYCADLKELIDSMNVHRAPAARPADEPGLLPEPAGLSVLDDVAGGYGSGRSVAVLAGIEVAITRALLWETGYRAVEADPYGLPARSWQFLLDLERRIGGPAALDRVLCHPFLRVWATACLRGRRDAGHLASVVAAVALRHGADFALELPVRDSTVYLPSYGTIALPWVDVHSVLLSKDGQRLTVTDGHHGSIAACDHGRAAQYVTLSGTSVLIEDADPYRDCFDWPAAPSLTTGAGDSWITALRDAWRLIERDVPQQMAALQAGLRAVVPLESGQSGTLHSASAQQAFGAVATQWCEPSHLAVQVVHEFQHSKMTALLDGYQLFDPSYKQLLRVGWRTDSRPIDGVLQGTYAHLAVAQVWRARAAAQPSLMPTYLRYRDWTASAVEDLLGTRALTAAGDRLVQGIGLAIAAW
jgi:uncharacterized protein